MLNLIAHLAESGHQVWFGENDTVTVTQVRGDSRVVLESILAKEPAAILNLLSRYGASVKAVDDKLLIWRDVDGDDWACDRGHLYRGIRGEYGVRWEVKLIHGINIHSPFDAVFWFAIPWASRVDVNVHFSIGNSLLVAAPAYITLSGQLDKEQVMAWVKLSGMQNATSITER
ncbi:hypothetical protein AB7W88_02585 [Providencia vermicola]|jgi:hypothetical protein|uniref:Uncharacterized protein n=6 Tax=Morganellaceae TaxID=1903414 RepID=A0A899NFM0_PROST|nr:MULTISPECIES: hypothetical protein [Enterobacterales]EKH6496389.1 hypothetical protein [Providencia rettgeri]ELB1110333.1 hypothetical protein [Morganella morganii]ELL8907338.1 hypothetical protein [Proteus mirabilis]ELQ1457914.1 hypothetical protein [Providencia rettgeri]ELR5042617.1 hypothetical protein [Providencia rettgeri]